MYDSRQFQGTILGVPEVVIFRVASPVPKKIPLEELDNILINRHDPGKIKVREQEMNNSSDLGHHIPRSNNLFKVFKGLHRRLGHRIKPIPFPLPACRSFLFFLLSRNVPPPTFFANFAKVIKNRLVKYS